MGAARTGCLALFDHGLLYLDGIYEGMRAYGRHVFSAADHYTLLERSARATGIKPPYGVAQIDAIVREGLRDNGLNDAYIRLVVTSGVGAMGPDPIRARARRRS